ncbi:spore coat protein U domain-containing protein [Escherichia fergusonii]
MIWRWGCLLLLMVSGSCWAVCSVNTTNGALGTVTSFAVNNTVQTTSASLIVQCDKVIGLLTNDTVKLTYTGATISATNRAILKRSDNNSVADAIPVRLCTQAACAGNSDINIGGSYTWSGNTLLDLLVTARYTLPLYFATITGQNVSAGPYQVTLNFSVTYNICAAGVGICLSPQTDTVVRTLQLNLTVTNDCITITAPNVNFGSAPLAKNFPAVVQAVAVTCTKGSSYSIGINNGSYATGTVRNMANGNNRLSYEIYKESSTNRWGSTGTERWASSASSETSSDGLLKTYSYTARVLPNQSTPPAGTYSDTVVVDIAF